MGISTRSLQRWRKAGIGSDRRCGPRQAPPNKLSKSERDKILKTVASPEFRDLPPTQIVPILADRGEYIGSESTIYRTLRAEGLNAHSGAARPPRNNRPDELKATGPNQIWTWDITYLKGPIRGQFYYLYMVVDIFSRDVVAHCVHEMESAEHAAIMIRAACNQGGAIVNPRVLHSDNGSAMKGATLLATLQELGIATSFSRPRVSNDNPISEALFKTAKYRPDFPDRPFESLELARKWVNAFVYWYREKHRHSGIRFVTPGQRHRGEDVAILAARREVYHNARERNPNRWSGPTRNWSYIESVTLNPVRTSANGVAA